MDEGPPDQVRTTDQERTKNQGRRPKDASRPSVLGPWRSFNLGLNGRRTTGPSTDYGPGTDQEPRTKTQGRESSFSPWSVAVLQPWSEWTKDHRTKYGLRTRNGPRPKDEDPRTRVVLQSLVRGGPSTLV